MTSLGRTRVPVHGKSARVGTPVWPLRWITAAIVAMAMSVGGEQAKRTPDLAELVPAGTFVVVCAGDVPSTIADLKRTSLHALWCEPQVQEFLSGPAAELRKALEKSEAALRATGDISLSELTALFSGRVSFAFIGMASGPRREVPELAFLVDVADRERACALITSLKAAAQAAGAPVQSTEVEIRGRKVEAFGDQNAKLYYVFAGRTLLAGLPNQAAIERLLSALDDRAPDRLAVQTVYTDAAAAARAGESDLFAYVNPKQAPEELRKEIARDLAKEGDDVKNNPFLATLASCASYAATVTLHDGGLALRWRAAAPGEAGGAAGAPATGTEPRQIAQLIPEHAAACLSLRTNWLTAWRAMLGVAGRKEAAEVQKGVAEIQQELGLDLEQDLLAQIGDEAWAALLLPVAGVPAQSPIDAVLVASVKDPARVRAAAGKLAKALADELPKDGRKTEWKELEYRGHRIAYVSIKALPIALSPAYAVTDDYLLVALTPQTLKVTISRLDAPGRSILDCADFKAVTSQLPRDCQYLSYVNLRTCFLALYGWAAPLLQQSSAWSAMGLDAAKLPTPEVIAKHLSGTASALTWDARGVTFGSHLPTAGGILLPLAVPKKAHPLVTELRAAWLIKRLGSDDPAVRRQAAKELAALPLRHVEPMVTRALKSPDANVRAGAADALAQIRTRKAVEAPRVAKKVEDLIRDLSGSDYSARRKAEQALMAMGEPAVSALVRHLGDIDLPVRDGVAQVLRGGTFHSRHKAEIERRLIAALGSEQAALRAAASAQLVALKDAGLAGRLIGELKSDDPVRREEVIDLLTTLPRTQTEDPLLAAVQDEDARVRSAAAYVIGESAIEEGAPRLETALGDDDAEVRGHAAAALAALRPTTPGLKEHLMAALESRYGYVRRRAVAGLAEVAGADAMSSLTAALGSKEEGVRAEAAAALGIVGDPAAAPSLSQALTDPSPRVRMHAALALGDLGARSAAPDLIAALADSAVDVRRCAASALGKLRCKHAVPGLLELLGKEDAAVHPWAGLALVRLGEPQGVDALVAALTSTDHCVRAWARKAFLRVRTKAAISGLVKALTHPEAEVRRRVTSQLSKIGDRAAVPALVEATEDEDASVRSAAAGALGKIGDRGAVARLVKMLADDEPTVRRAAASALGTLRDPRAASALAPLAEDTDRRVRYAAITALGMGGDQASLPVLIETLRSDDKRLAAQAARALGEFGDRSVVPSLIEALKGDDRYVQRQATVALGKLGAESALPALAAALSADDVYLRVEVARAFRRIGDPAAVESLKGAMKDANTRARTEASAALAWLGDDRGISVLLDGLKDRSSSVRSTAIWGLLGSATRCDVERILPSMIEAVGDSYGYVRRTAISSLARLRSPAAVPCIRKVLRSGNEEERRAAAWALGRLRDGTAVPRLVRSLRDDAPRVRENAAWALGEISDPETREELSLAIGDERDEVRIAARVALLKLGNADLFVMNPDGSGRIRITKRPGWDSSPVWSPDGSKLAFTARIAGNYEVCVIDADGSGFLNLTKSPRDDGSAAWSPDGRTIAFMSRRDGNSEIYVMRPDGTDQRRLTRHYATDTAPVWSPDGSKIAYASYRGKDYEIRVMDADGTNARNLTRHPALDTSPAWSPDGRAIAFVSDRSGRREIWLVPAGGGRCRMLGPCPGPVYEPCWSPDGKALALAVDGDTSLDIYAIDADGSNLRSITKTSRDEFGPAWCPKGRHIAFMSDSASGE